MDKRLSVTEAAEFLGVCEGVVYALVRAGELAHYRIGQPGKRGRIVILESDCNAYMSSRRVEPGRPPAAPAPTPPIRLRHLRLPS